MNAIGYMAMPAGFSYREVFYKGKPRHEKFDDFSLRHPPMDVGHRAKIFAPFDALKGFNEAVSAKNVRYERRRVLSPEDEEERNRCLEVLHSLTVNTRVARKNRVPVSVTYYEPCSDENNEAYGVGGRYLTVTDICWKVDAEVTGTILVGQTGIPLGDVFKIEFPE